MDFSSNLILIFTIVIVTLSIIALGLGYFLADYVHDSHDLDDEPLTLVQLGLGSNPAHDSNTTINN